MEPTPSVWAAAHPTVRTLWVPFHTPRHKQHGLIKLLLEHQLPLGTAVRITAGAMLQGTQSSCWDSSTGTFHSLRISHSLKRSNSNFDWRHSTPSTTRNLTQSIMDSTMGT